MTDTEFGSVTQQIANDMDTFQQRAVEAVRQHQRTSEFAPLIELLNAEWRGLVREAAGLPREIPATPHLCELHREFAFLLANRKALAPMFRLLSHRRMLFPGQCYYNAWYLSRGLRERDWKADLLNWDLSPASQIYYHGHDFTFAEKSPRLLEEMFAFFLSSLYAYDLFHFSNAHGISFGHNLHSYIASQFDSYAEIALLRGLSKVVVYTNNGCSDGVSQTAFATWGDTPVCSICRWRTEPSVCGDERNLRWGNARNLMADYQCLSGGNRVDYNDDPRVHEEPEVYCLDAQFWHPDLAIPPERLLPASPPSTVRLYHAVGNAKERTTDDGVNIKSSHVYLPLVERLQQEGLPIELISPSGVPNTEVRFLQAQSDIVVDMLSYGWFGANAREAMMLGKPVICWIRPDWLESVRGEIPEYADELPIVSATPETVESVLRELIADPDRRRAIGARSRAFAEKWHSHTVAAARFDEIYTRLLQGEIMLGTAARGSTRA